MIDSKIVVPLKTFRTRLRSQVLFILFSTKLLRTNGQIEYAEKKAEADPSELDLIKDGLYSQFVYIGKYEELFTVLYCSYHYNWIATDKVRISQYISLL